ncbi:MAG: permease [Methylophaga sp.]|nr:permease [Methylophaga sp.]
MTDLLDKWSEAAVTSLGFFWMALWAFVLGYLISSIIQVMVSRHEMRNLMGGDGPKSMSIGTLFGFISSSCSFAALATTRALFQKGANFSPSIAFLLSSTNLVIELGFVIALFLGWQFVVGEYVGGIILILLAWLFIILTNPKELIHKARERNQDEGDGADEDGHAWSRLFDKEI